MHVSFIAFIGMYYYALYGPVSVMLVWAYLPLIQHFNPQFLNIRSDKGFVTLKLHLPIRDYSLSHWANLLRLYTYSAFMPKSYRFTVRTDLTTYPAGSLLFLFITLYWSSGQ